MTRTLLTHFFAPLGMSACAATMYGPRVGGVILASTMSHREAGDLRVNGRLSRLCRLWTLAAVPAMLVARSIRSGPRFSVVAGSLTGADVVSIVIRFQGLGFLRKDFYRVCDCPGVYLQVVSN